MHGLTRQEIMRIVNRYIGVSGGYLGDFSYRTHAEFYPEYCGLDIDPGAMPGTTRQRFVDILEAATPQDQAKIVRGVLDRFPVGSPSAPESRTSDLRDELLSILRRLSGVSPVPVPTPKNASEVVQRAIGDAEALIRAQGAVSGVDRVHTALHGYLRTVCADSGISYSDDDGMTKLLKAIRKEHAAFRSLGARSQDVERVLYAFASIMDALNPIRNSASVAHPNELLLGKEEAMLVINAARTILHYLDAKIN